MGEDTAEWRAFSDGWFDFYFCSKCGYRTIVKSPAYLPFLCPFCKSKMLRD